MVEGHKLILKEMNKRIDAIEQVSSLAIATLLSHGSKNCTLTTRWLLQILYRKSKKKGKGRAGRKVNRI